jgi:hypothetical protein
VAVGARLWGIAWKVIVAVGVVAAVGRPRHGGGGGVFLGDC